MYSIDINEVDINQLLAYISYALKNDKSIVFFKLPGIDSIHIVQGSKKSYNTNEVPNNAFVWNSFLDKNKLNAIIPEEPQEDDQSFEYPFNNKEVTESTYDSYKKRMRFALEQLRAKSFEKVVVARTKHSPYSNSPLALFLRLINSYKNAFCYLLIDKEDGVWCGASPELLWRQNEKSFETSSLAGTGNFKQNGQNIPENISLEHDYVLKHIKEVFNNNSIEFEQSKLEVLNAGPVKHLKTSIKGEFSGDAFNLIDKLHPTPAVCGFPQTVTRIFIRNEENFDRGLYTGYIGPVFNNQPELYVNLRCVQLQADKAILYAGGGVIKDASIEDEWNETEKKIETILPHLTGSDE